MKATEHKETGVKMQVYEVGYLLVPSITEENVKAEVSALHSLVEKAGGTMISEDHPKLRGLSYSMSKVLDSKKENYDEAYFGWIKFELPVLELAAIEAKLKTMEKVLRYLVIKTIRENTMFTDRIVNVAPSKAEEADPKAELGVAPEEKKAGSSEEEIDKSIDALVI